VESDLNSGTILLHGSFDPKQQLQITLGFLHVNAGSIRKITPDLVKIDLSSQENLANLFPATYPITVSQGGNSDTYLLRFVR